MSNEVNVLALIKGTEHYIYIYDDGSRAEVINTFRDQAADPGLSLNWFDAMVLTAKSRDQKDMEATPLVGQESGLRNQESGIGSQESGNTIPHRFSDP